MDDAVTIIVTRMRHDFRDVRQRKQVGEKKLTCVRNNLERLLTRSTDARSPANIMITPPTKLCSRSETRIAQALA
jgi:hypothetical protein